MRVAGRTSVAVALVLAAALPAAAQPASEADTAFKRARELFKSGDYKEACEQFEKSQALDPQHGTQFNLAQCDEKIGKLATAVALYREVATKDTNLQRRKFAADLAAKLMPRVPKVVIDIDGNPEGLAVQFDGRSVAVNTPLAVDLGEYELVVEADGMREVRATVRITDEGKTTTVVVPMVMKASGGTASVTQRSEPTTGGKSSSSRRTVGIVTLVLGGATLATGAVFGSFAFSDWSGARNVCGGMTCSSQEDADRANKLRSDAMHSASISNVLFVAGGVLATLGVVLWVTAPSTREVAVSASATSEGTSVLLSGSF